MTESPSKRPSGVAPHSVTADSPITSMLAGAHRKITSRLLGLDQIDSIYRRLTAQNGNELFVDRALDLMGIGYHVSERDRERLPVEGPVIVVSNHPFGGVDGLILLSLLASIRPDAKVMANYILGRIQEIRESLILVDPFEYKGASRSNFRPLKEALSWLSSGGMLGMFPAGEVSHVEWTKWEVTDPPWNDLVARLVLKTKATVVPIYFPGHNNRFFQAAGLVHPLLRTALLPRELLKKRGRRFEVRVGRPIWWEKSKRYDQPVDLIKYLRWRTYMLASRQEDQRGVAPLFIGQPPQETAFTPVNVPADALAAETAALPPDQLLVQADSYRVYFARAPQIPNLLQEIGRQREITFREVGEGTGREIDLDRYDDYYLHLFVWNQATSEVVGGYRLGFTDVIRNRHGIKGLYTHSLFRYGPRFYHRINPAIELGRSFVKPEYQKSYHALMLLWKGIGRLVARSPKYKILFGPVSITSDYDDTSRHLIAAFFKENTRQDQLARLVKPRTPLRRPEMQGREFRASLNFLQDIKALSDFISEIEDDEKGIPILLKQYLKLGGRSLAFNVDPAFSNALDSLIVVDLTKTDKRILERYMGKEDALAFRRHHGLEPIAHCA